VDNSNFLSSIIIFTRVVSKFYRLL